MPPPKLLKREKNDIKSNRANIRATMTVNESSLLLNRTNDNATMTVNESPSLLNSEVFTNALIKNIPARIIAEKTIIVNNNEIKKWEIDADFSKEEIEMFKIYEKNGDLLDLQFVAPQLNSSIYTYSNNHPREIYIPDSVYYKMKNKIFTHNHPKGTSFSRNDLSMAFESKLAGMEAVANTKAFWDSIQSISTNKNKILSSLDEYKKTYKRYGMNEYIENLSYMEDFVKKAKYNKLQPIVKFQITPKEKTTINENGVNKKTVEWDSDWKNKTKSFKALENEMGIVLSTMYPFTSPNSLRLLLDHAMTKHSANKLNFNYSISTHKD